MEFEGMEAVFGKLKGRGGGMLYLVGGLQNQTDGAILRTLVTDFHENTWGSRYSRTHLEEMRDYIGIGGSWSDFVEYVTAALQARNAYLDVLPQSRPGGSATAKLVAQKARGMPRVPISVSKLSEADASEVMASLSLELYNAYHTTRVSLINEEKRCSELTKVVSSEQEKNETLQRHIDTLTFSKKQKVQMTNGTANQDDVSIQSSPGKQVAASTKVANRAVPAYRRARVRGAFLKDEDDEKTGDLVKHQLKDEDDEKPGDLVKHQDSFDHES